MFNQLFQHPKVIRRKVNAPLLEERLRYLTYRAEQETAHAVIRQISVYQLIIIKYLRLKRDNHIYTFEEIETAAKRWVHRQKRRLRGVSCYSCKDVFVRQAKHWLQFLGRLGIPKQPPLPSQVAQFVDYMRREQNLSEATIATRRHRLQQFFRQIKIEPGIFLAHLAPAQLDAIQVRELNRRVYSYLTIQKNCTILRAFFRYAERQGWCRPGIADCIQSPRIYKHATLPYGPSWEDVQRLLKTTEGNRPSDIRARAIILLLAVYGLRAGEACRLRLEDFDWEQKTFRLKRSKFGPIQRFPLVHPLRQALIRYLKEVRPQHSSYREIFLTLCAPFRPLHSICIYQTVSSRWKPFNVAIKHYGPHSLRHACASRLINQGMPLKTIADQLGHHDLETTRIYAKVDLTRLREVARRCAMRLRTIVNQYIAYRQSLGNNFRSDAIILNAFVRAMGQKTDLTDVKTEPVTKYLAGRSCAITSNWHRKYGTLSLFYKYVPSRGYTKISPLPIAIPKRPPPFVPYIYAAKELRALFDACLSYQKKKGLLAPYTIRTLLLLLYGAGLRISEALSLTVADVDLSQAFLIIRNTKFHKTRIVPIGKQLTQILLEYAKWRKQKRYSFDLEAPFFLGRNRKAVKKGTIQLDFRLIRKKAGIRRTGGSRIQPRIHDLRHTFAVHRLTAWYKLGADVQRLLPVLSVYMGHVCISSTSTYLTMTPALLEEAGRRFEQYAFKEVSHD